MKLTTKEYLDLLVETSAKGGFPATNGNNRTCRYLTNDGKRCAIGLLIPGSEYSTAMEGRGCDRLLEKYPAIRNFIPDGVSDTELCAIQSLHDSMSNKIYHDGVKWNHEEFVLNLKAQPCFQNLNDLAATPSADAQPVSASE